MSDYRRFFVPGGTYFFTIVTQHRRHLFATDGNVNRLRDAVRDVQQTLPFTIDAAVVLPDHLHFIWSLPPGDRNYSQRIGMMKVGCRCGGRRPGKFDFSKIEDIVGEPVSDG